jgi:hypothetical protein
MSEECQQIITALFWEFGPLQHLSGGMPGGPPIRASLPPSYELHSYRRLTSQLDVQRCGQSW